MNFLSRSIGCSRRLPPRHRKKVAASHSGPDLRRDPRTAFGKSGVWSAIVALGLFGGGVPGFQALAQSFQGPAGANYAGVFTNFGITGAGVGIVIVEHPVSGTGIKPDHHLGARFVGQWDFDGLTPPVYGPPPPPAPPAGCALPPSVASGESEHATLVADLCAGGVFGTNVGVAPGALVAGVNIEASSDFTAGYHSSRAGLQWLAYYGGLVGLTNGAVIYNLSYGYPGNDSGDNPLALYLDWFSSAFLPSALVVVAAGNDTYVIRKPGDCYNGITVGATDDSWQRRLDLSGYALSPSPELRGKPDLLAPGANVSDGTYTSSGTSFAAPQVSGAAGLLWEYGLNTVGGFFGRCAKAILLNSARKRFVTGENQVNAISSDAVATASQAEDADYLDGFALRSGGSGTAPLTENWTPSIWTNVSGALVTSAPFDDEQGTGLLDVQRALAQMVGPGGPGTPGSGFFFPGPVPHRGWSVAAVDPEFQPTQVYSLTNSISSNSFITVTLCWDRWVGESNAPINNPGVCETTTNAVTGQADLFDTYFALPLENLDLKIYRQEGAGNVLLAWSASTVANVEHLHVPVPVTSSNYFIEVSHVPAFPATNGAQFAIAWWVGSPQTSQPVALDFGDAPDPTYPTHLANDGARHLIVPGFHLGAGVDGELDGQPDASATGDDLASSDDEDGVAFLTLLTPGSNATVQILASTNGLLNAWLDFNANGAWTEPGEQIFTNQSLVAGANLLTFAVPASAGSTNTFARFRFSSAGGLSFTGEASDGEVEDYTVNITCPAPVIVALTRGGGGTATKIVFTTRAGCTYTVEYKDSLDDPSWTVVDTVAGTGGTVTVLDSMAAVAMRYYRVRTQ